MNRGTGGPRWPKSLQDGERRLACEPWLPSVSTAPLVWGRGSSLNFDLASFLLSCGGPGPQTQGAAVISWATSGSKTGRDGQLTKVCQTVLVLKPRAPGTLIEADQGAGPQGQPRSPWPRPSPCARGLHRFPKYNGHSRTSLYSQGLAGRGLLWSWTRPTRGARPPAPRAPPPPVTRQRTAGPAPTRARGWRGGSRAGAGQPRPLRPRPKPLLLSGRAVQAPPPLGATVRAAKTAALRTGFSFS